MFQGNRRKYVAIRRDKDDRLLLPRVRWCSSLLCKLRGLTFRRHVGDEDALLLVERSDSTSATAIHMMFVFCPLATIWINSMGEVVDCKLAKPFRPIYFAQAPARYVLEGPPLLLEIFQRGDRVRFEPIES